MRRLARLLVLSCVASAALFAGPPRGARAAFPGANGKIAFMRYAQGVGNDIWVIDPDGTNAVNLTNNAAEDRHPDFSADGAHIAYLEIAGGQSAIRVMDADGSGKRTVTSAAGSTLSFPTWSPDGTRIAVGVSPDGFSGHVEVYRAADGQLLDTLTPASGAYFVPTWRPTAAPGETDIAVIKIYADGMRDVVRLTDAGEVAVTTTPGDQLEGGQLHWSPDGDRVLYRDRLSQEIIAANVTGGQFVVQTPQGINGQSQDYAPDGGLLIYDEGSIGSATSPIRTVTVPGGSPVLLTTGTYPCWGRGPGAGFSATLGVFTPTGEPLEGELTTERDMVVKLTLSNGTDQTLRNFRYAGGAPLVADSRSKGGVAITATPVVDPGLTLDAGESVEFSYRITTTKEGLAAAHTKVTARDDDGNDQEASRSLLFHIDNAGRLSQAIGNYLVLKVMDQYLLKTFRDFQAAMQKRAQKLVKKLGRRLSPTEREQWFGAQAGVEVGNWDRAIGLLRGVPPELVAAQTPKAPFQGHTAEELNRTYDETFKAEVGEGFAKWVKGYTQLDDDARKTLHDSWAEGIMNTKWLIGAATPDERAQVEAFWSTFASGVDSTRKNIVKTAMTEIPRWEQNGTYAWEALEESEKSFGFVNNARKSVDFWSKVVKKEQNVRASLLKIATSDPVRFQEESAKADARIFNKGMPILLDTLLGAGISDVATLGGTLVKVSGKGASVISAGKAGGWLADTGRVVMSPNAKLALSGADDVVGVSIQTAAEMDAAESLLKNTAGATLVQSSDVGNVYSLPNLGGVPETTLEAKAGILSELEQEYADAFGKPLKLAEVLKTSSPLRKPGGVAKLELTAAKTGKPSMIDGGMPSDALGEAVYWTSPTSPQALPGFDALPQSRKDAALKEWSAANERWVKYENPPAGSKEAKLKSLIGTRGRVALDDAPNASGLQRFIVGEFEEVVVTEGDATAKLIRVKHYEIEVVDTTRNDLVVNRKTVLDNLPTAAAQTADADAVAVGKVVGHDPGTGAPIIAPLDRAEREFVMSRYTDKNIKARRTGAIPDLAEHGVTLVMEDASARAAGFLLPSYGAPFLPESIARKYLERIAPFVKTLDLTDEQMVEKMLSLVQKEGGFGQHAVLVTSDSRYLGAVPFARW